MRKLSLVIGVVCVLSLTGCASTYRLTEVETDIVAENMAALLLKYDHNYQDTALLLPEEALEKEVFPAGTDTHTGDASIPSNDTKEDKKENKEDTVELHGEKEYTLSQVISAKNFDIQYKGYQLYINYPEDTSATYFSLTPREGDQLLAVLFDAVNTSNDTKSLNLIKTGNRFELKVNEERTYVPLLTLLENDLQYINIPIDGQKTEEVILVFEIPKEEISAVSLTVTNEDKAVNIPMK
jgi:hypothetical protein